MFVIACLLALRVRECACAVGGLCTCRLYVGCLLAVVGLNWQREAVDAWVPFQWANVLNGNTLTPAARAALASFNPVGTSCNNMFPIKVKTD